jgi:lysophospholipase L1-like esterase
MSDSTLLTAVDPLVSPSEALPLGDLGLAPISLQESSANALSPSLASSSLITTVLPVAAIDSGLVPTTANAQAALRADLLKDNGDSSTDRLTSIPDIIGTVASTVNVDKLLGKFKTQTEYTDLTTSLGSDGKFQLDRQKLGQIFGTALADGSFELELQAVSLSGSTIKTAVQFTLDSSIFDPQATNRITKIDDRDTGNGFNQFKYSGSWNQSKEWNAYGQTASWTNEDNASYEVKFNGTQAKLFSIRNPWGGIAGISIDGGSEVLVDTYGTDWQNRVLYQTGQLAAGDHTIKVRVTGQKNAAAGDDMVAIDSLEISTPIIRAAASSATEIVATDIPNTVVIDGELAKINGANQALIRGSTPNPLIAFLAEDDGLSFTDRVTSNPEVTGAIAAYFGVNQLLGKFKNQTEYWDLTSSLGTDGRFQLSRPQLAQVFGSNLADGYHQLDLKAVSRSGDTNETSLQFTLDSSIANPTPTTRTIKIDDRDTGTGLNHFQYGGNWNLSREGNAYGQTASWTNEVGASYEVKFSGTQARLYNVSNPWGGIAAISVNGGAETLVDTYGTDWQNRVLYQTSTLADGEHTIKVRVTGQKSATSGDHMISIDALEVTTPIVRAASSQTASIDLSTVNANSNALLFSPYTWTATGNGAQTSNAGAYLKFRFNGTQATLNVDNTGLTSFPLLDVFVDGQQVADQLWLKNVTNGQANIYNGSAGNHDVVVYFRRREIFDGANPVVAAQKINDWSAGAEHLRVTGVTVDGGSGFLENTFRRDKTAVFFGDSITEGGPQVFEPTAPDRPVDYPYANVPNNAAYKTYAARLGDLLGVDYGQVGWSGSGWLRPNTPTGNPPFTDSWLRYNGQSSATRDFNPQPDYIFVNLGTNDTPFNSGENSLNFNVNDAAYSWIKSARERVPGAEIFVIYPFNQTKNAELRQAIVRYQTDFPADRQVHALNLGAEGARGLPVPYQDSLYIADFAVDAVHPTASRHQTLAGLLLDKIEPTIGISNITIDDRNTASGTGVATVKYVGAWQSVAESGSLNGDNHVSSTANDTYEVQFYGDRVQLFGTKGDQRGIAAISIDGGAEVLSDLYSASSVSGATVYQSVTLNKGYHTIKVRVTGQRNSAATGTSIALDKLVVY